MEDSIESSAASNEALPGIPKSEFEAVGSRSVSSKAGERNQLAADIEAFLNRGGQVEEVNPNVTSDPPQKPSSSYGSRPI